MCGIAGAVGRIPGQEGTPGRDDARLRALVQSITDAQGHRGPDGCGVWHPPGGEVVFGHRRLAILDLSERGAQPMVEPGGGCAVTFNGEVYNFAEIRAELEADGESFRSGSDTEVVLKSYRRWGIDALRRFRGIFALALWDARARAVHLARDPMGIKPLYWTAVRDGDTGEEVVLFASELRALLASGAVPRRADPGAVASYLWHGFVIGPQTMVEGVHLLPAATVMTVEAGGRASPVNLRRQRAYWRVPSSAGLSTVAADVHEELERAVRMQLVSDVPLGVFLSGGVDSSAVAALAAGGIPEPLHTFTVGFEEPAYDETPYARRVAEAIGSRHTCVRLTEADFQRRLPDALAALDQPTFDGVNTFFVARAAREAGIKVALAGTGGDELFGGYPSFAEIPRFLALPGLRVLAGAGGRLRRPFDGALAAGSRLFSRLAWEALETAPPQTRWGKVADVARAGQDVLALYQVFYALFTRDTQDVLAAEAVRDAQRRQCLGLPPAVAAEWRARIAGGEPRHAISVLELSSFLGERLLRDTDAASMAVALEVRVPLLDHVLVETVAGVDPRRRFSPPGRKQLLRDAVLGRLDPAVFERPKAGFVLPIDAWARRRLQPHLEEVFADERLCAQAGLRAKAVRTLWRSFCGGRPGLYWSRVWALYVLLSWCRRHQVSVAA